jgi:adenylate cyclase
VNDKVRFRKVFAVVYTLIFFVVYRPTWFGIPWNGVFYNMQGIWHDFMFRSHKGSLQRGDKRLILLAVDEESGKKYGFPLPRAVYARALDRMKSLGVNTVIFDVMFFEKRDGDAELAAATKRFGHVVHLYAFEDSSAAAKLSLPIAPLAKAGSYFGAPNVDYLEALDGHVRTFQLFRTGSKDPFHKTLPAASAAAAALASYTGSTLEDLHLRRGEEERFLRLRPPYEQPRHEGPVRGKDKQDAIWSPFRRVSLLDLLDNDLSADQRAAFKGSIVIVGSTALGYYDSYPTAFEVEEPSGPGAEIHLTAIDNALNGDSMSLTPFVFTVPFIIIAILLTYLLQRFPTTLGTALAGGVFVVWVAIAFEMFSRGVMIDFVPPAVAFAISYLALTTHRVLTEDAEKEQIKSLFGQFVSPEVVKDLAADPSKVKLGGEKRELTIFFLDIAHFTNISEKMDPAELIQFLNRYLSALSDIIFEHHGTIDKYIGDCIMAFWNAPEERKDHRADALLAALDCQRAILELNKKSSGLPEIPAARIGINSGLATVGLTGTHKKLQYTVIGDEVNLASRLEGANKFFGSKILVSEATYEGAKDRVVARCLGRARVVGKETPIRVYEPIGEKGKLSADWTKALPIYEKGFAAFEARRYGDALDLFESLLKIFPDDGPGRLYRDLSRDYAAIPPDASWDGVFNLTAK